MEARTRYAKTGDFNIAYQVVGDGPIDLVLSPGAATHLELAWDVPPLARFLDRLASFSRLILFDKRGTGLSDRVSPDALPTLEGRMADVRAVMDAARSERAALFGTLGGGAMCGLFASTYPERTDALILYWTFGKIEPDTGLLSRIASSEDVALDRIEREWGTEGVSLAHWAPSLVTDDESKAAYLRLARSALSPGSARTLFRLGFQVDWEAVLPSIQAPTLVLHRSGDQVAPIRQGRRIADGIPGATFVELSGTDHFMWAGDQDSVLDEVESFLSRLQGRQEPKRMLCSLLFTDIVSSTETATRLGDEAWSDLLGRHHAIVRHELDRVGGVEVDTAGDGFLATFDGPARAVDCAIAISQGVRKLGIAVRAGVHTGECSSIDGKVGGIAVVIASRIMALGGADEVLVSQTVRDLVMGSGIEFEARGAQALKGVPGEWAVYRTTR